MRELTQTCRPLGHRMERAGPGGFTLVEVIVAVGLLAGTVVALVALLSLSGRLAEEIGARNQAAHLADAVAVELGRLRDVTAASGSGDKLDALAAQVPESFSNASLRLVASRDGLQVVREADAETSGLRLAAPERFYLIEVRQLAEPLNYLGGDGFLAVTVLVRWPYQIKSGAEGQSSVSADQARSWSLDFSLAVRR